MEMHTQQLMNGIDTDAVAELVERVTGNHAEGQTTWTVTTEWMGGTRSDTHVSHFMMGGERIDKDFTIKVDEPYELGGTNEFANPQEHLMAAMNACIMATYVVVCAMQGIELEHITIESSGDIDLRGFLGIDPNVKAGYDSIRYTVNIKGEGTQKQFERVHRMVLATSPNYFNMANAITMNATMNVM